MNHDQTDILEAMHVQGWHTLKQRQSATMAMSGTGKIAIIRSDRSMEILKDGGKVERFCYVQAYKGKGWLQLAVSIATAAAKTSLTSEQFGAILHAIGVGRGHYVRPGYRNYYDAGDVDRPHLDKLVEGGFAVKVRTAGVYRVTPKGAAEVGCAGCLEPK